MSDLIRREDVMALWEEYHPHIAVKAIEFGDALKEIPSAQPEPKHGKWIDTGKTELNLEDDAELRIFRCSECGLEVSVAKYPHEKSFFLTPFCSNCGAKMEADHDSD